MDKPHTSVNNWPNTVSSLVGCSIGVGRGGGGAGGGGGGGGGAGPPNNLRGGGATYPLAPPIIHPSVPAKLFLSILSLNFL